MTLPQRYKILVDTKTKDIDMSRWNGSINPVLYPVATTKEMLIMSIGMCVDANGTLFDSARKQIEELKTKEFRIVELNYV